MSKSKKLVFFGTEDFSAACLTLLITAGWEISAVVTKPDSKAGRGRKPAVPMVKHIAKENNIAVLQPEKASEIAKSLDGFKTEFGVLAAYGKIIPSDVLRRFSGGIINLHPSLLPKYRGPAPIEAAILNGDKTTGVSIMKLVEKMDAGPVYAQKVVSLDGTEDRTLLYQKLAVEGAQLLVKKLPLVTAGRLKSKAQDEDKASYTKLIKKSDGNLDFKKSAKQLERQVRAYAGWPKTTAKIYGQKIVVTSARAAETKSDGQLVVPARAGYLEILELVAPSGRMLSGSDFVRGYRGKA